MRLGLTDKGALLATFHIRLVLIDRIRELQTQDQTVIKLKREAESGPLKGFSVLVDGTLMMGHRLCVPDVGELKKEIMEESHSSAYAMHPGSTKMYHTLREHYWCRGMKKDVAKFVYRCLICQQVKAEHQRPAGLLQSLPTPQWKWEKITMDFVVGLSRCQSGYDAIWVIVDRLTKSAYFLPMKNSDSIEKLVELYLKEIVRLHGTPVSIVSDRDPWFTSRFWPSLQRGLGTRLHFSMAFHPQTDGQSERTIQTLEDMLRACVLEFKGSWDRHLPLMEFAYNNSYQSSIEMAPYECRTPLCWDEVGERKLSGLEIV